MGKADSEMKIINEMKVYRPKISREKAEQAIKTILHYIGEDTTREGLVETPKRVIDAFSEFFKGYSQEPHDLLGKTFHETHGYQDIVLVRNISFSSYCEHHIVPFVGTAHVAYLPEKRVVGISKLARVVEIFARRLQNQERLTQQIATSINEILKPRGVAVLMDATHFCMATRGVRQENTLTTTLCTLGDFENTTKRAEIISLMNNKNALAG